MKNKIVILLVGLLFLNFVGAGIYYNVEVEYNFGEVSIQNIDVLYLKSEKINYFEIENKDVESYNIQIKNFLGDVVYDERVSVPNMQIVDYVDNETGEIMSSEVVSLDNVIFDLYFPYTEDVNQIIISDLDGEVIEEVDVVTFAKVRGDVSSDKDNDGDVGGGSSRIFFYFLLAIVIVLIAVFVIIFYKKK